MTKEALVTALNVQIEANQRLANDAQTEAFHRSMAIERYLVLRSAVGLAQLLDEPPVKPDPNAPPGAILGA